MTNMDSALMKFLLEDYPRHRGKAPEKVVPPRREEPHRGTFEIRDQQERIIQEPNAGVSVIRWQGEPVEVIDFEGYIKQFGEEGVLRCDFVIAPVAGDAFVVFNELTESEGQYIEKKQLHAWGQLAASIERFYEIGNLLDDYQKKVALFSYRLTDDPQGHLVMETRGKFRKPRAVVRNIFRHELLPHGFLFERRLYPEPYLIS